MKLIAEYKEDVLTLTHTVNEQGFKIEVQGSIVRLFEVTWHEDRFYAVYPTIAMAIAQGEKWT